MTLTSETRAPEGAREPLRVLDLFSGIGGFSLGLERTGGFKTVAFCEIEPFPRRVLAKHWPEVPSHDDVETRSFTAGEADVVVGGFPCQDISFAGRGAGLSGSRSGLYRHLVRAIRLVRPRFAVLENVAALLDRGLGSVLGDLAEDEYDAEWDCVGADRLGASQGRERVWILADANDAGREGPIWAGQSHQARPEWSAACGEPLRSTRGYWPPGPRAVADIPRMADGVPDRAHRLRALGNAVVPQIPELIGHAILRLLPANESQDEGADTRKDFSGQIKTFPYSEGRNTNGGATGTERPTPTLGGLAEGGRS